MKKTALRQAMQTVSKARINYNDLRTYKPTSKQATWVRCRRFNVGGLTLKKEKELKTLGCVVQRFEQYGHPMCYIYLPTKQAEAAVLKAAQAQVPDPKALPRFEVDVLECMVSAKTVTAAKRLIRDALAATGIKVKFGWTYRLQG